MSEQLDAILNIFDSLDLAEMLKDAELPSSGTKPERVARVRSALLAGKMDLTECVTGPCYKESLQEMCRAVGVNSNGRVEEIKLRMNAWFDEIQRSRAGAIERTARQPVAITPELQIDKLAAAERDVILVSSKQDDSESVVGLFRSVWRGAGRLLGTEGTGAVRVSPGEAERLFQFDPGHPIDGHAYIRNPHLDKHYLAPAQAADRIVQERMNAFRAVCAALGARRVEILSVVSQGADKEADLSAAAMQMNLAGHVTRNGEIVRRVCMEWPTAGRPSPIPERFRPMLNANPDLRALEEMAHAGRLPIFYDVHVEIRDSEEIAAKLMRIPWLSGAAIGGEMKTVSSSNWTFRVGFDSTLLRCRACSSEVPSGAVFCVTCGGRIS